MRRKVKGRYRVEYEGIRKGQYWRQRDGFATAQYSRPVFKVMGIIKRKHPWDQRRNERFVQVLVITPGLATAPLGTMATMKHIYFETFEIAHERVTPEEAATYLIGI